MGTERARKGQHLLLYIACVIILVSGSLGCSNLVRTIEARQRLEIADRHLSRGDFDAAFRANEDALQVAPEIVGDQALYKMSLVDVHPDNPCFDYQKSAEGLQRLLVEYPESPLTQEAAVLLRVFREIDKRDDDVAELQDAVVALRETIKEKDTEIKEKDSEIEKMRGQMREMNLKVKDLQSKIEGLKEIDLGIEEKKREAFPK